MCSLLLHLFGYRSCDLAFPLLLPHINQLVIDGITHFKNVNDTIFKGTWCGKLVKQNLFIHVSATQYPSQPTGVVHIRVQCCVSPSSLSSLPVIESKPCNCQPVLISWCQYLRSLPHKKKGGRTKKRKNAAPAKQRNKEVNISSLASPIQNGTGSVDANKGRKVTKEKAGMFWSNGGNGSQA